MFLPPHADVIHAFRSGALETRLHGKPLVEQLTFMMMRCKFSTISFPLHGVHLSKQNLHNIIPKVITVNNNMIQSYSAYLSQPPCLWIHGELVKISCGGKSRRVTVFAFPLGNKRQGIIRTPRYQLKTWSTGSDEKYEQSENGVCFPFCVFLQVRMKKKRWLWSLLVNANFAVQHRRSAQNYPQHSLSC